MNHNIIGREKEVGILEENLNSTKSEFVAVYGRRRVGKTYLIRETFNNKFSFYLTGLANVGMKRQLAEFHARLVYHFPNEQGFLPATDWFEAFRQLAGLLEKGGGEGKKIIFIDELPWLDTRNSKFLSGLEHFWNSWASARRDVLLIACGSAASWMINNLLRNRGGLHNRVTERIKLEPFNLYETEQLLKSKDLGYDRYQVIQAYMAFGGIPYYLERLKKGLSATQNINLLCFDRNAPFRTEYEDLYASLFKREERHSAIIEALSEKKKGLTRLEIIQKTGLSNGGGLSRMLKELEESSFIRSYRSFGKKQQDTLYQLVDLYSLFYLNFIKNSSPDDENFWLNAAESPTLRAWTGYAFEMVCLHHVPQIKKALGIGGVQSSIYAWQASGAQVDLVIDRKDQVVNLCEMKFSISPFAITKEYADKLRQKTTAFKTATKTRKSIFITLVTTHGLVKNQHAYLAQNDIDMNALFKRV